MRERETEITPWPTGIVPLPVQGDRTLSPIRGRRSNQMTFGGQLSSRHSCGPCLPNPDADAATAEQHPPKEAMEAAVKPTLVEMVAYSCTLF